MNRHNVSKIKPKMPTIFDEERENNMIHKSQLSTGRRSIDYPKEDLYNIDADWNDKSFDSTSNKVVNSDDSDNQSITNEFMIINR